MKNGLVWDVGSVFLIPSVTDNTFGLDKWILVQMHYYQNL